MGTGSSQKNIGNSQLVDSQGSTWQIVCKSIETRLYVLDVLRSVNKTYETQNVSLTFKKLYSVNSKISGWIQLIE